MKFDNKSFEAGIRTSINSLNKLKVALNLNGAEKNLSELEKSTKGLELSGLAKSVDTIASKFTTLGIIGVTALQRIANSAITTGKNLLNSLTLEPIMTGFSEYETKINAIQTIMSNTASKGTTMADVTKVIDELNTYADKTIYNFAEMTRNIGTFTAAGVGLEDSAAAIQGIANLAAASGSNSQQASTAMYQLSQALAAGTVKLMDWNSVVNAGMGGEKFQLALQQTAKEFGINVDAMIEKGGSFRESLQYGWISADVLNTTLKKFTVEGARDYANAMMESGKYTKEQADALMAEAQMMEDAATKVKTLTQLIDTMKESVQSGWGQTWEIIFGNFEEAKTLWTSVSDVFGEIINESSDARNEVLSIWAKGKGKDYLFSGIKNTFNYLTDLIGTFTGSYSEAFKIMPRDLIYLSRDFYHFSDSLALTDSRADKLKRTFNGLFAGIKLIGEVFFGLSGTLIKMVVPGLNAMVDPILTFTATAGDMVVAFRKTVLETVNYERAISAIGKALSITGVLVKEWYNTLKNTPQVQKFLSDFNEALSTARDYLGGYIPIVDDFVNKLMSLDDISLDSVKKIFKDFINDTIDYFSDSERVINDMKAVFSTVTEMLGNTYDKAAKIGSNIMNTVGKVFTFLKDKFSNFTITDIIAIAGIGGLIYGLTIINKVIEMFSGIPIKLAEVLDSTAGLLDSFAAKNRADAFMKVAQAVAVFAAAITVLALLPTDKVLQAGLILGAFAAGLMVFSYAMARLGKTKSDVVKMASMSSMLLALSASLGILSASVYILGQSDFSNAAKNAIILVGLMGALALISGILSSKVSKFSSGSLMLLTFSGGIYLLAKAMDELSSIQMDSSNIKNLVGAMVLLMGGLAVVSAAAGKSTFGSAVTILSIGLALRLLVGSLEYIANFDYSNILKNLDNIVMVVGALIALSAISRIAGKGAAGLGILFLSVSLAIIIMKDTLTELSKLNPDSLMPVVNSLSTLLIALGAAVGFAGAGGAKVGSALSILAIAGALVVITGAIKILGQMSVGDLTKGTLALTSVMAMLAVVSYSAKYLEKANKSLIKMAIVIGSVALVLGLLSMLDTSNVISAAAAMSAVLLSLAVMTKIASGSTMSLGGIAGMIAVVASIGLVIGLLAGLTEADSALTVAGSLSLVMLSLSGAMAIMSLVPVPAAVQAAAGLLIAIGTITAVIAALGAINSISGAKELMTGGADMLGVLGSAIGKFIGGLIGGIGAGFSENLGSIGSSLSEFAETSSGFFNNLPDETALNGIAILTSSVLALSANDFVQGINKFFGIKSFSGFGEGLTAIGEGLVSFSESVSGLDENSIEKIKISAEAAQELVTLANSLPNTEGLWGWLSGKSDLGTFGTQLSGFGSSLIAYTNSVASLPENASTLISDSVESVRSLSELSELLPSTEGLWGWLSGKNDLGTFGKQLSGLGSALSQYAASVSTSNLTGIDSSITMLRSIIGLSSEASITNFSGISNLSIAINELGNISFEGFISALNELEVEMENAGENGGTKFVSGIKSKTSSARSAAVSMASSAAGGANSYQSSFQTAGENAAYGFANGIKLKAYVAKAAAARMAQDAVNAANAVLDVSSPSKVLEKTGMFFDLGMGKGIERFANVPEKAATKMANGTVQVVKSVLSELTNGIPENLDVTPTIRPVLDLSNIQNGNRYIRNMLNSDFGVVGYSSIKRSNDISSGLYSNTNSKPMTNSSGSVVASFVQNNYSPKSLSRSEIYRQTKGQFATFKERVLDK